MENWNAVVAAVGERYEITGGGKGHIRVANENVEVTVSLAGIGNGALLVFAAPVTNPLAHEPAWALRQNGELAIGALAQTAEGCVVRHTAFGDSVNADHISLTIDLIAEAAARLSEVSVRPAPATLFAAYAE